MAFVIETGAGTPNANAYTSLAFALAYLTDQGRELENSWSGIGTAAQQDAVVKATSYIDRRFGPRFKGIKLQRDIPGRAASGVLTFSTVAADLDTVTVGQVTYRFVDTLAAENDVLRGTTAAESIANLALAINVGGDEDAVEDDTRPNYEAKAVDPVDGSTLDIEARAKGVNGNEIALAVTGGVVTVSGATLTGGIDEGPQPLAFPRDGLYDRFGTKITGVPLEIRQVTTEYAVRSVAADLAPDPTVDASGATVQRVREKVGPIETETEYVGGAVTKLQPYPAADRLLTDFLTSGRGVMR